MQVTDNIIATSYLTGMTTMSNFSNFDTKDAADYLQIGIINYKGYSIPELKKAWRFNICDSGKEFPEEYLKEWENSIDWEEIYKAVNS